MAKRKKTRVDRLTYPEVGDDVYVRTSLYIDHGEDDFCGGLCEISFATQITGQFSYNVKERPGSTYHAYDVKEFWDEQARMKKEYGRRRGRADPDYGG